MGDIGKYLVVRCATLVIIIIIIRAAFNVHNFIVLFEIKKYYQNEKEKVKKLRLKISTFYIRYLVIRIPYHKKDKDIPPRPRPTLDSASARAFLRHFR